MLRRMFLSLKIKQITKEEVTYLFINIKQIKIDKNNIF